MLSEKKALTKHAINVNLEVILYEIEIFSCPSI